MGGVPTTPYILAVLEANPGREVSVRFISKALKEAGTPLTDQQINSSMSKMNKRYNMAVTTVIRGQVWRYDPDAKIAAEKKSTFELFELVGETGDGSKIVRDESMKLYKLTEI